MTREEEFAKAKDLIKEHFSDAECGMFFTENIVGDTMTTIFEGNVFTLNICYSYSYYELFGCTESEQKEIEDYYEKLGKERSA